MAVPNERYDIPELTNEESSLNENSDTVLKFQNLSVDYGGIMVLKNVNLSVKKVKLLPWSVKADVENQL